ALLEATRSVDEAGDVLRPPQLRHDAMAELEEVLDGQRRPERVVGDHARQRAAGQAADDQDDRRPLLSRSLQELTVAEPRGAGDDRVHAATHEVVEEPAEA